MITSRYILCSMGDFIQSKHVYKAVRFLNPLKRLKLKTFASDDVL